jgi:lipopolysaccharide assembly outer membrane protein LptD (OstA)
MKFLVALLVLFPFLTYGQSEPTKKLTLLHAGTTTSRPPAVKSEKKKQKDDVVYMGDVKFQTGNSIITCDSAVMNDNDGIVTAYNVKLSNPESFDIKGGIMTFTKETKKGVVTANVVVSAKNNTIVGLSESIEVDFSEDNYQISRGALTTPQPPDNAK